MGGWGSRRSSKGHKGPAYEVTISVAHAKLEEKKKRAAKNLYREGSDERAPRKRSWSSQREPGSTTRPRAEKVKVVHGQGFRHVFHRYVQRVKTATLNLAESSCRDRKRGSRGHRSSSALSLRRGRGAPPARQCRHNRCSRGVAEENACAAAQEKDREDRARSGTTRAKTNGLRTVRGGGSGREAGPTPPFRRARFHGGWICGWGPVGPRRRGAAGDLIL